MRTKERRQFSREYKLEALRLMSERGPTATSENLGISASLLYKWRVQLRESGPEGLGAAGQPQPSSPDAELKALRARVRELEEEREILKKAAAYFAKHTR